MDTEKHMESVRELIEEVEVSDDVSRANYRSFLKDLQYDIELRLSCLDDDDKRDAERA